jgi:uncharacterized protein (TIRG00374 family)
MRLKKEVIGEILKLGIALSLISVVLSQVSIESITELWQRISVFWLLISILAFYTVLWSMARRYWLLIGSRVAFHEILHIVLYQNVMGNLIATSAGAALYVGVLRNKHDIPVSHSLLSLLLARFGDLLILVLFLSFATVVVWQRIATLQFIVTGVICLLTVVALGVTLLFVLRRRLVGVAFGILRKWDFVSRFGAALVAFAGQEANACRFNIVLFAGYSILVFSTMLIFAYCSLQVFGVRLDIWPVIFVVSLTQVMTLVPIQVLGGLGLQDVSYLYLYGLFGINQSEFAVVVVGLRIAFVCTNLLCLILMAPPLGLVTQILLKKKIA